MESDIVGAGSMFTQVLLEAQSSCLVLDTLLSIIAALKKAAIQINACFTGDYFLSIHGIFHFLFGTTTNRGAIYEKCHLLTLTKQSKV